MATTRVRPSQVTIVVVLIWIAFALTVVGAIATVLVGTGIAASDPARVAEELKNLDLPESWSTGIGPIVIVAGALMFVVAIIQAIFAVTIGRGSNVARILLTILLIIRIISGVVFILTSWGTETWMFGVFLAIGLDIVVLLLLFNSRSNEFFTDAVRQA
ncbi:MAG: hypothetical protein FJW85_12805 [Actinobacteria bacterium]|nr:hypothetical protein [Actinomycetota bacterium]